jgi:protein LTV1
MAHQGKSRAELESSLSPDDLLDPDDRLGEAALYGITYDDSEYDYMQHLRPVGVEEEGVESILIEAPPTSRKASKASKQTSSIQLRDLPAEALPSTSELSREEAYESHQNIPSSLAGFQPDMDPHLRQVLEALEDDAFVEDNLEDDFFAELVADGQRGEDDEMDFEFREEGIPDNEDGSLPLPEENPESWEARFAQFKKTSKKSLTSDSGSESGDTVGRLPTISATTTRYKRRRGSSEVSGFSMSSVRTEAQQTLDDRFEQVGSQDFVYESKLMLL